MTAQTLLNEYFVGNSSFVRPSGQSFWEFLNENDIRYEKSDFPFLTNSKVPEIKQVFDFSEFLTLKSKGEVFSYLYNRFGKSLNYVGAVLDLERTHGFNDHSDTHTLWVTQQGIELLQNSGHSYDRSGNYDNITEVMMALIGMTHDMGNFLSRSDHSIYSVWMLSRLFKNIDKHPREWWHMAYSILFHEEPVLKESGNDLASGFPLQWALVAADKMHVGRDRIGLRSFITGIEQGVLEQDAHVLLNALVVRSTWFLEPETFVWNLSFTVDQLEQKFSHLGKDNNRIWVPENFQKALKEQTKFYRDSYADLFCEIYGDRMNMAAEAVFFLFPSLTKFQVRLTDIDTRQKVGSKEIIIKEFTRK